MKIFYVFLFISLIQLNYSENEASVDYHKVNPIKVGLALSGGAAKGFAHLGVLKVFEEEGIPVDLISGTSMGSVIGGLYSVGCTALELEEKLLKQNWDYLLDDKPKRNAVSMEQKDQLDRYVVSLPFRDGHINLPSGLVAGQRMESVLATSAWPYHNVRDFSKFKIPFAAITTDLESGDAVTITSGNLPEAMRASIGLPNAFTPKRYKGKLLADGMMVRNFPVKDVIEMGADIVIGVDVGSKLHKAEKLDNLVAIMDQTVSFTNTKNNDKQRALCDVLIRPNVLEMSAKNFDRIEDWIKMGEDAARKALPEIKSLLKAAKVSLRRRPKCLADHDLKAKIISIKVEGNAKVPTSFVIREAGLKLPSEFSEKDISAAISKIYRSLFFELVSYQIDGQTLVVKVKEKDSGSFNFGLRYDRHGRTEALINTTVNQFSKNISQLLFDMKLGNKNSFKAQSIVYLNNHKKHLSALRIQALYQEELYFNFDKLTKPINELDYKRLQLDVTLGSILENNFSIRSGLKLANNWLDENKAIVKLNKKEHETLLYSAVNYDSLDSTYFPKSGEKYDFEISWAASDLNNDSEYVKKIISLFKVTPLNSRFSLLTAYKRGHLDGKKLSVQSAFAQGGYGNFYDMSTLYGFDRHSNGGNYLQSAMVGAQYELLANTYVLLRYNVGSTGYTKADVDSFSAMNKSGGITLAKLTKAGPLEFSVFHNGHHMSSFVSIGYSF
ncbi:MAG: patatin-like phospholipase family protein [Candidatus Cloacimonetes bacterium]|nr:patatin-like phospholipase family protein [Candidatus Cloacimonadota bacterium]